ncbi:LVIVD repeat-containing protein [Abyssalbus ytuae]|uniref:LVIVD repeat-containing protein n=1 Tax=Abyssalbus ytuae TaxID=2926907 RepID=A0A9E6ZPT9_9FLAO|nr:hypothetical protein [Abyssalbus ytuae]UOB18694.1 hypothetical protein MQE35_05235 [Abyssalbus ytuae]
MKVKISLTTIVISLFFLSCDKDNENYEMVNVATPEVMNLTSFRESVVITTPSEIKQSGKIYVYGDLVLVNDVDEGIHIIDNSNPENPQKKAFIKILANKDMEVKGDYLYADSLMDLVVFDISDLNDIREVERLEDVFPQYIPIPFVENVIVDYGSTEVGADDVIIGWDIKEERRRISDDEYYTGGPEGPVFFEAVADASANSTGQGGSLARFKIVEDYLYAVDSHSINIFDLSSLQSPQSLGNIFAGFDIETIFNKGEHLFLGSMRGMYIYNISSPETPVLVSEFEHGTACDPVVVDNSYAYITLRAGNFCGALDSSLQIVDITNLQNPELVKSYPMDNPYGLGIKENLLFICDGASGLKVYNKSSVEELQLVNHFESITAYDVIPLADTLIMIGDNTLYQYKYENGEINLLSQFSLN